MEGARARLDEEGVSLWRGSWTITSGGPWTGQRIVALVGGAYAGRLDVFVHPDEQAVSVIMLDVDEAFRRRNLGAVMMDALYAAYPTAWIDHGGRTQAGAIWWDRYRDPAPERNIHNVAFEEWAEYFNTVEVAAQRARNARHNALAGLDGHRGAEYRYGERLEEEAGWFVDRVREPTRQGPDPAARQLYGGMRVLLPPGLYRRVHDSGRDPATRAEALLRRIGHGNLPAGAAWHTTEHAAYQDLAREDAVDLTTDPVTHVTFHLLPLPRAGLPQHEVKSTWIGFVGSPGIEVRIAGMSWRSPSRPWVTHRAAFSPPVNAAIAPEFWQNASPAYLARYDMLGELRPGQSPYDPGPSPFAGRESDIRAAADRLLHGIAQRSAAPARPVPERGRAHQQTARAAQPHSSPARRR